MFCLNSVTALVFLGVCSGQAPSTGTGGSNDLLVFTQTAMVHIDVTTGQSTSFPKPSIFSISAVDHDRVDNKLIVVAVSSVIFSCNMDGSNITYLRDWTSNPSPFTDSLAVASDERLVFFGGSGRQVVRMSVTGEHETSQPPEHGSKNGCRSYHKESQDDDSHRRAGCHRWT
ncbi:uncharacterized protein LOC124255971 isoform X1 [Haliotis rubra]|uniref:uncharacterized protein LOC124255971 isoform X1 n=1 Tax=Haliotis rubra TaxID=36100 RepID=UPI001EE5B42E|nr:uncharacterized protein LOC124255971 isoform X1 [Haliotis rubra]